MNKFLILSLCSILFTGCVKKPTVEGTELSKEHEQYISDSTKKINDTFNGVNTLAEENKTRDIDILSARKFVSDYDVRIKNSQEYIDNCVKDKKSDDISKVIENCTIIAYDMNNIFRQGETAQIAPSEKERYREKLEIAQQTLSTELEN